jgi:uncharacterized protein with PQ loop repeat
MRGDAFMLGLEPNAVSKMMLLFVTVITFVSYVPQIVKILRTKEAEDLSKLSWAMWLMMYITLMIYAFVFTKDILLLVAYIAEVSLCLVIWIMSFVYGKKRKA